MPSQQLRNNFLHSWVFASPVPSHYVSETFRCKAGPLQNQLKPGKGFARIMWQTHDWQFIEGWDPWSAVCKQLVGCKNNISYQNEARLKKKPTLYILIRWAPNRSLLSPGTKLPKIVRKHILCNRRRCKQTLPRRPATDSVQRGECH